MNRFLFSLLLFSLGVSSLYSQAIKDVSGTWYGNSNFLKTNYKVHLDLKQQVNQLDGVMTSTSMVNKDSLVMRVNGFVEDSVVKLFPSKVIFKKGLGCLSNFVLNYSEKSDQPKLNGTWKGDVKLKTCPPLVGGEITLYKSITKKVKKVNNESVLAVEKQEVNQNDDAGMALMNELGKRKYYALIIGVEEYADEEIQKLDRPIEDGEKLGNVLMGYYSFKKENVTFLKNPNREMIISELDALSQKVTEKDNLLIFYAGHGVWNSQLNQGYWLPSDASMNSKSFWISNSTIRDYVGGIRAKHTLLISDACFSGGILKERAIFENSRAILELYKLPSRKAMTSGTLKTVPDKSVFIEYLIKNLETNTAPLLSADQLFRNFKIAVINNSPNGQVPQYGPITQAGDEGGDFIFYRPD